MVAGVGGDVLLGVDRLDGLCSDGGATADEVDIRLPSISCSCDGCVVELMEISLCTNVYYIYIILCFYY